MKIIFFIRSLAKGGAEKQLSLLASLLSEDKNEVIVLTYYSNDNNLLNPNYARLINSGVRVISLEKKGRYDMLFFMLRFMRLIRCEKPDVVYSFLALTNVIACLSKLVNKKIKLIWGQRSSDLELARYNLALRMENKLEKWFAAIPNQIICNSNSGKEYLIKCGYPIAKLTVVPNGFEAYDITQKHDCRSTLFHGLPITHDTVIIGTVGRIDFAKDYDTLIMAVKDVVKEYPNIVVLILGRIIQKEYFGYLEKMIEQYALSKHIFFLPEMDNIADYYNSLDIFVSSSYTEGFSNVVAEAMLHELPCLVTDAGDNAVLVGDAGFVVQRRNSQQLGTVMLKLLCMTALERDQFGIAARLRILKKFGLSELLENTKKRLVQW